MDPFSTGVEMALRANEAFDPLVRQEFDLHVDPRPAPQPVALVSQTAIPAAELAAATTIVLASRMGIPVSTTHTLVGAVLGVGLARGIGAVDMRVVGSIVASWVATLPIAAGLAIFFYYFFKGLLG